jgi:hypothetical protein
VLGHRDAAGLAVLGGAHLAFAAIVRALDIDALGEVAEGFLADSADLAHALLGFEVNLVHHLLHFA